jgi:hypothetical protein
MTLRETLPCLRWGMGTLPDPMREGARYPAGANTKGQRPLYRGMRRPSLGRGFAASSARSPTAGCTGGTSR